MIKEILDSGLPEIIGLPLDNYLILKAYYIDNIPKDRLPHPRNKMSHSFLAESQLLFIVKLKKWIIESAYLKRENYKLSTWVLNFSKSISTQPSETPLIRDSDLPTSVKKIFKSADIITIYDITKYSKEEISRFRTIGKKSLRLIEQLLKQYGLKLK